jgi:hypothetical protein
MGMSLFDGHRPASSKKFFSLLVELIPRLVKNGKMGGQDGYIASSRHRVPTVDSRKSVATAELSYRFSSLFWRYDH